MNRKLRFATWYAAAAGAMAASLADLQLLACGCLAVLVILLWTTPPTAIRLPVNVSVILITGGVALLQFTSLQRGRTTSTHAVLSIGLSFLLTLWLNHRGASPWWAAPLVWGPWMALGWTGVACVLLIGPPLVLFTSRYCGTISCEETPRL